MEDLRKVGVSIDRYAHFLEDLEGTLVVVEVVVRFKGGDKKIWRDEFEGVFKPLKVDSIPCRMKG